MEFGNGFLSELVSCFDLFSFCSPFSYFSLFAMLMKMDKVAKAYNASFVVSSSELGEYDSLMQNATQHFPSLRLPWYTTYTTTTSSKTKGQEVGCFSKKITTSNRITSGVIGVDTELLKDYVLRGSLSGNKINQLHWLIKTLAANSSNWRIIVGYHSREPYSIFLNGNSVFKRELANGFLLHHVSSDQIVTNYINFAGEVVCTAVLQQKGREIM
ncbi:hypothetical protein JHK82_043059 [Glycine max]|uniref:Uncharacterized protein n=1 Tax=Glycine max TaxID=3847 RepID=I1MIF5_SOYBN|nr:hypothetical protein GLYMA_15G205500v4 [Glycine max]KAG4957348.1 hypothetical protein JHK85_043728 [Glycine max]KAG5106089.1 hypothetical protein JHK82_043059 [Glycine max]KAH1148091.1 hypothetical protein GYH30_042987 [Glycine max]KAH1148096.1 hypothetical protein GYH30_042987 [Glycine max]